jgi:hypothetical protein
MMPRRTARHFSRRAATTSRSSCNDGALEVVERVERGAQIDDRQA